MYNILICDDQPDIVNALKIYLAPEGYHLFEAFTGKEALDIVQKNDIHLILLDVMMPVMDGITATAKIRDTCSGFREHAGNRRGDLIARCCKIEVFSL